MTIDEVARKLYAHELNFSLSCFWDGGFDVKLGDAIHGFKAEANFATLAECAVWLDERAREYYPGYGAEKPA